MSEQSPFYKPQKIAIFGLPGSGKSSFAIKLHRSLGLPLHHLDKYFFVSHWVERDYDEFLAIQQELVAGERWIIDGCSLKSLEMRWARADVVIYFQRPRFFCLWGLFRRFWDKDPAIDDRAPGCREAVTWKLILYMWRMHHRGQAQREMLQNRYPQTPFVTIKSRREARRLFKKLVS